MLTQIPSSTLRQLVKLSARKEKLMARIQAIDREMVRIQNQHGIPTLARERDTPITFAGKLQPRSRRAKRGALKARILGALRGAGSKGLTIGDLSTKLGVRNANLYVWFNGTGRKVRGLKKIGPARYRLSK